MDGLTEYTIKKGNHFCWPRVLKARNRVNAVFWKVVFDKNSNYNLGNNDQEDWNKVLGLYFNFFNPRDNTVMVGWRYRPDRDLIELNAYYHLNKQTYYTESLMHIRREEAVYIAIRIDWSARKYLVVMESPKSGAKARHEMPFAHPEKRFWEINFYFGGNRPSPQEISIRKGNIGERDWPKTTKT
ncbi:MAG: hypothetical protein IPH16_22135 [Haliscomenobacter sp.]|nr:hypothetical protein [Haliscomenobacter sp.]MBK7476301.1 hypothetical protein [Haliscomenobacter sp.]MBK8879168.1 hypothetical protein [Haliscomenobacter sp.]